MTRDWLFGLYQVVLVVFAGAVGDYTDPFEPCHGYESESFMPKDQSHFRTRTHRHSVTCQVGEESLTKQAFRDECDINRIVARFTPQQLEEQAQAASLIYADFTGLEDYASVMNRARAAELLFENLDVNVRDHFDHNPDELVRAAFDPSRRQEFVDLGLAEAVEAPPGAPEPAAVLPPTEGPSRAPMPSSQPSSPVPEGGAAAREGRPTKEA